MGDTQRGVAVLDLTECRCLGPDACRHRGVFRDEAGNDLPGLARWSETVWWLNTRSYPSRAELYGDDESFPIRVRLP